MTVFSREGTLGAVTWRFDEKQDVFLIFVIAQQEESSDYDK